MTTTVPPGDVGPGPLAPKAERIAEQAVDYIREHGLPAFQLRTFASSIGTSHRMIIHYFGSRDGLLGEVFHRLRLEDISRFRDSASTARQMVLDMWDYYAEEVNHLRVHMFFDLVGTAFQQPDEFGDFLDSLDTWVHVIAELAQRDGFRPTDAKLRARTVLAGWRGLLIELHSKGDRTACDQSLRILLDAFFPEPSEPRTRGGVRRTKAPAKTPAKGATS